MNKTYRTLFCLLVIVGIRAHAQVDVTNESSPVVGREAAGKYMGATTRPGPSDHYLAVHLGSYVSSASYEWGQSGKQKDPGEANFGVTYRVGEWVNTLDLLFRADFSMYNLAQGNPFKMALVPLLVFPDSASRFPLYFGAGIGPGVFLDQITGESVVTLDYQLLAGIRFFNLYDSAGVFFETGIKNHVHLISDGQFNGIFVSLGGVFSF